MTRLYVALCAAFAVGAVPTLPGTAQAANLYVYGGGGGGGGTDSGDMYGGNGGDGCALAGNGGRGFLWDGWVNFGGGGAYVGEGSGKGRRNGRRLCQTGYTRRRRMRPPRRHMQRRKRGCGRQLRWRRGRQCQVAGLWHP